MIERIVFGVVLLAGTNALTASHFYDLGHAEKPPTHCTPANVADPNHPEGREVLICPLKERA